MRRMILSQTEILLIPADDTSGYRRMSELDSLDPIRMTCCYSFREKYPLNARPARDVFGMSQFGLVPQSFQATTYTEMHSTREPEPCHNSLFSSSS